MQKKRFPFSKNVVVMFCGIMLAGCAPLFNDSHAPYYYDGTNFIYDEQSHSYRPKAVQVNVPHSPLLHENEGPISHKDKDRAWISKQSNYAYTITLSEGSRASVANALHEAPKSHRTAQIKNKSRGTYLGVYGSYQSHEQAVAALNNLPEKLRNHAHITDWSDVKKQTLTPMDEPPLD